MWEKSPRNFWATQKHEALKKQIFFSSWKWKPAPILFSLSFMFMASTVSPQSPYSLFLKTQHGSLQQLTKEPRAATARTRSKILHVFASQKAGSNKSQRRAQPGVDTRIHWENEDEGWIGGSSSSSHQTNQNFNAEEEQKNLLGEKFADLLDNSSDSHYQ